MTDEFKQLSSTNEASKCRKRSPRALRYKNCGIIAGSEDRTRALKYGRLFAFNEYCCVGSFLGGTLVIKSFASSADAIDSPIMGSKIWVYRKEWRADIVGTAVAAVHEQSNANMANERPPDKTKLTLDVAASRHALPMRIISTK